MIPSMQDLSQEDSPENASSSSSSFFSQLSRVFYVKDLVFTEAIKVVLLKDSNMFSVR